MLPERRALTRTSLGQMECKTSLKIVIRNCALCPRPVKPASVSRPGKSMFWRPCFKMCPYVRPDVVFGRTARVVYAENVAAWETCSTRSKALS